MQFSNKALKYLNHSWLFDSSEYYDADDPKIKGDEKLKRYFEKQLNDFLAVLGKAKETSGDKTFKSIYYLAFMFYDRLLPKDRYFLVQFDSALNLIKEIDKCPELIKNYFHRFNKLGDNTPALWDALYRDCEKCKNIYFAVDGCGDFVKNHREDFQKQIGGMKDSAENYGKYLELLLPPGGVSGKYIVLEAPFPSFKRGGLQQVLGSVFIVFKAEDCNKFEIETASDIINSFRIVFSSIISRPYFHKLNNQIIRFSLKSAIAAIMSRNMSHNLGSHILINLEGNKFDLNDMKLFLRYLRSRMDFLAQVATDWPSWSLPTRFVQDLMAEFLNQVCMLEFIAASEGLNTERLKINMSINGEQFSWLNGASPEQVSGLRRKLSETDRFVSVPGGFTGRHALYVILENIIRNAAKHSYKRNGDLEVNIGLTEGEESYSLDIWDNVSNKTGLKGEIEKKINRPIVEHSGEMDRENWGIAEMKISSTFLKKEDPLLLSEKDFGDQDILTVGMSGGFLKYKFEIMKPKEVGIWRFGNEAKNNEELRKQGIYVEAMNKERLETNQFDADYQFLIVYPTEKNPDDILQAMLDEKILEMLPYRIFFVGTRGDVPCHCHYAEKRIVYLQIKNQDSLTKAFFDKIKSLDSPTDENVNTLKIVLYALWTRHARDTITEGAKNKKLHLYIGLKAESESLLSSFPAYSEYLETHYPYLVPEGTDNPAEIDRHTQSCWEGLNKIISNDVVLKEIIGSISFEKQINSKDDDSEDDDSVGIAYPRHGQIPDSFAVGQRIYSESLSGVSPHFNLLASPPGDLYQQKKLCLWLIENGLIRIAIADERIVGRLLTQGNQFAIRSGIYLISSISKDRKQLEIVEDREGDGYKMSIQDNLRTEIDDGDIHADALIIHQGVLDKLIKRDENGESLMKHKSEIHEWITALKDTIPFIVVTSGRGRPTDVPYNAKFLPFSDIQQAFTTGNASHGKMILTHVLMNARNGIDL